ncbi:type II secretion system protein [bacterium]|nr:type II secretion system protein [bacterium]
MKSKMKCFTLAEMLIVMVIIGIMAMLAIPTVIQTSRDKTFSDMLNKEYQRIENALILEKILGFDVSGYQISSINQPLNSKKFFALLLEKLKTIKNCGRTDEGCFGTTELDGYKMRLLSGAGILVNDDYRGRTDSVDPSNAILGSTYIDIDGPTGANKPGVDQFGFYTTFKGLIPMGGPQDEIVPFSQCLEQEGFACTAWVLVNKNMDYKNCPKVINWETKTRCD